ncbi:DUF4846 domain-containing protein [Maribacter sp. 2308TA10-17]|uniref:DUF4846 domain-containing protein n=1 Tax=Maribacter sp. 2308TA10-17 TaxID=3386276 RepID=UPI0039BD6C9F
MRTGINLFFLFGCTFWMLLNCGQNKSTDKKRLAIAEVSQKIDTTGNTIVTRFQVPEGFDRISADSNSFSSYLRNLPLKPAGSLVTYFNGDVKPNQNVYDAVVDLPIGKRDLHQCADAVMRLRADYLFQNKKYDSIHFNFINGFKADYANWRKGKRILVKGNKVSWKQNSQASDSAKDFWKYLEMVFSYAGTASLEKEMKSISLAEMRIGDVFIKGGFPGHALIVVDMAHKKDTNEKIFLLAQSYMPAQEIQVLKNPNNTDLSPWYGVSEISNKLRTPEWTFKKSELKRF